MSFGRQEHPKDDDGHETIELDKYEANPAVYKNVRCDEHNKKVTRYCTRCEMLGCTLCEDLLSCKSMCFVPILSNFAIMLIKYGGGITGSCVLN